MFFFPVSSMASSKWFNRVVVSNALRLSNVSVMRCRYLIVPDSKRHHSRVERRVAAGRVLTAGGRERRPRLLVVSHVQKDGIKLQRTRNWNQSEMSIWHKTKSISTEACRTSKTGATTCLFMRCDWAEGIEATYSRWRQLIVDRNEEQELKI